jgi:hypothetical protein
MKRLLLWLPAITLVACGTHTAPVGNGGARALGACPDSKALFANAICVCGDFRQSGHLVTHASADGQASIGVNGRSSAASGSRIEGSWSSGDTITISGDVDVQGDLSTPKDLDGSGILHVGGIASVGGTISRTGDLKVSGGIVKAAPATLPCDCNPATELDVAGTVALARTANDNAAHGVAATALTAGSSATLALDSGRYYFEHVTSLGNTKILAQGNVSIYIDGGLDIVGDYQLALAPGASLDVYVSGNVMQSGVVALGGNPPSSFRLFVGGARAILAASGEQTWSGLVYAPSAWVTVSGRTNVSGAIFAGSFDHAGDLDVWYGAANHECAPPPPTTPPPPPTPPGPTPPSDPPIS